MAFHAQCLFERQGMVLESPHRAICSMDNGNLLDRSYRRSVGTDLKTISMLILGASGSYQATCGFSLLSMGGKLGHLRNGTIQVL